MAAARLIRFTGDEVTWYEVDSPERLALLLSRERPRLYGAYGIRYTGWSSTIPHFVFSGSAFTAHWKEAAQGGFAAAEVRRLFLSGPAAVPVARGQRPNAPAYEPNTGTVWVAEGQRSVDLDVDLRQTFDIAGDVGTATPIDRPGELVRRTPHMDVPADGELSAGAEFRIEIYCDRSPARSGEQAEDVEVELPPGQDAVTLGVWLALSPHFESTAPVGEVTLTRGEAASTRAVFDLAVSGEPPPGSGQIAAVFHHEGRSCGQITRTVALGESLETDSPAGDAEPRRRPPKIVVHDAIRRADLTIEIKATDHNEQEFACRVITELLPGRLDPEPTPWRLSTRAPDLVASYMEGFTEPGLNDGERVSRLRGAGVALWRAAPAEVREVFWELIDADKAPRSIFVISDEWSFPWELVVPERGVGTQHQTRDPLGVEFALGRWVTADMVAPPQLVNVVDSYVFAPDYPPELALPGAAAEANYVCSNLNGEAIRPGEFGPLEEKFSERGVGLVHFSCHGGTSTSQSQVLLLEAKGKTLQSHQISGMQGLGEAMAAKQPFVFLNACEVGRGQPALIGVGGFATEFIMAGASCVIAPLWTVADDIAHQLATTLYDELCADPAMTPAVALQALRGRAYAAAGADTWAAYCFYGDPLTRVIVPDNETEEVR